MVNALVIDLLDVRSLTVVPHVATACVIVRVSPRTKDFVRDRKALICASDATNASRSSAGELGKHGALLRMIGEDLDRSDVIRELPSTKIATQAMKSRAITRNESRAMANNDQLQSTHADESPLRNLRLASRHYRTWRGVRKAQISTSYLHLFGKSKTTKERDHLGSTVRVAKKMIRNLSATAMCEICRHTTRQNFSRMAGLKKRKMTTTTGDVVAATGAVDADA